ncbi:hypothetical protein Hanom_Chr03g00264721 [Helianthus anomalus]
METIITSHTVSSLNLKSPSLKSKFNPSFQHGPKLTSFQPSVRLQLSVNDELRLCSHRGLVRASSAGQSNATDEEDRWLLEPVVGLRFMLGLFSLIAILSRKPRKAHKYFYKLF